MSNFPSMQPLTAFVIVIALIIIILISTGLSHKESIDEPKLEFSDEPTPEAILKINPTLDTIFFGGSIYVKQ